MKPIPLKTRNLDEAKKIAKAAGLDRMDLLGRADAVTKDALTKIVAGRKVSFSDAYDMWYSSLRVINLSITTRRRHETYLKQWLREEELVDKPVGSINDLMLNAWVNIGNTKAIRDNRYSAIKSFCRVLVAKQLVLGDPSADLKVDLSTLPFEALEPGERLPFTADEQERLTDLPEEWRFMTLFSIETGARLIDCVRLTKQQLLVEQNKAIVWADKYDRRFVLPMSSELAGEAAGARWYQTALAVEPLFPELFKIGEDVETRPYLSRIIQRQFKKLGIDKTFHCARHTFATNLKDKGHSIDEIRARMGHVFESTTEGYVHV